MVHPDVRERELAAWDHAVATGEPYLFESRLRRADGSYGILEIRGVPVRAADGSIREWARHRRRLRLPRRAPVLPRAVELGPRLLLVRHHQNVSDRTAAGQSVLIGKEPDHNGGS
ncbi:MAG: PAS domain-containing protein [Thermoanaerobaculia bacterium]